MVFFNRCVTRGSQRSSHITLRQCMWQIRVQSADTQCTIFSPSANMPSFLANQVVTRIKFVLYGRHADKELKFWGRPYDHVQDRPKKPTPSQKELESGEGRRWSEGGSGGGRLGGGGEIEPGRVGRGYWWWWPQLASGVGGPARRWPVLAGGAGGPARAKVVSGGPLAVAGGGTGGASGGP
ncbi:uncharacterized protein LOC131859352 [Cryptomeria japonica]|uniref:uncharacterized protein LOC131859352 n=1 Tax=Cryptomeria japonica TaxID=3369 RepID=UPI0027DA7462|nr:uncharacterized protein LOC131859352 [Cryptomeria japonica]